MLSAETKHKERRFLYVSSYHSTPHIATSKWVLLPMNFFAARSKKVSMPFSRRRNRGRLTVRQLVAGGWWLVAGSAYGAGSRIGIGGRGSMGPVPTGATSHQPPRCHFDRSAVEWRNLTAQWCRPHYGGRSLGSEYQWSSDTFILIPV